MPTAILMTSCARARSLLRGTKVKFLLIWGHVLFNADLTFLGLGYILEVNIFLASER